MGKIRALIVIFSLLMISPTAQISAQTYKNVAEELGVRHVSFHTGRVCAGVALFDFNNDGLIDIYATGGDIDDHLYKNTGEGYQDVTMSMGFKKQNGVTTCGIAVGDFDKDGFDDLFITTDQGYHNILLKNNQDGTFEDVTEGAGIVVQDSLWSTSATFVDINIDGYLDLYVAHYVEYESQPFSRSVLNDRDNPIRHNLLYMNNGDGTFTERSEELNIKTNRATWAVTAADINDDYLPDLIDANDFGKIFGSNVLLLNDVPNADSLYDAGKEFSLRDPIDGMGVAIGDANNDLKPDVNYTDWFFNILKLSVPGDCAPYSRTTDRIRGICWGTSFIDFDNDTDLDIFTAYGDIEFDNKRAPGFMENDGSGSFEDKSQEMGFTSLSYGRGTAVGDFDRDGDMDIFLSSVNDGQGKFDLLRIYENTSESNHNWLSVYLEGKRANPKGYDATVYCYAQGSTFMSYIDGGSSFLSSSDAVAHFGLGNISRVDSLVIIWPGGKKQVEKDLEVNKIHTIQENSGVSEVVALDYECFSDKEVALVLSNSNNDFGSLNLYPNPVNETLHFEGQFIRSVGIFDMAGTMILNKKIEGRMFSLHVGMLAKGIYTLKLVGDRIVYNKKFQKI